MRQLAVLTPVVLLLLMVLLGRLERWLDDSTLPSPPRAHRHRWGRSARPGRSPTSVAVRPGRRLLAHRTATSPRQRPAATVRQPSVTVPRAARRHLLGGRSRHGGR